MPVLGADDRAFEVSVPVLIIGAGACGCTAALAANATPDQTAAIESGRHRLTAPDQMGTLFKVLVLAHLDMEPPPGFEHAQV